VAIARYLLGFVLLGVALGPIIAASSSWRSRLLPRWFGSLAVLADAVIALAAIICTAELLGSVGLFRLFPMTGGLALVGSGAWIAARRSCSNSECRGLAPYTRRSARSAGLVLPPRNSRGALFAALGAVSVVVGDWSTRTVHALNHGMSSPDTIWYHMPFAARFVQDGSITALHSVDFGSDIAFYPENGELAHALGILFLGNDFLSPLLNMGWLALAFLAAWCVGKPFGVAPVTLIGMAVVMATPGLVTSQPGGAYTDIASLALLASAVALLVNSVQPSPVDRLPAHCIAALATGLALGTKFTLVVPVVALTLGVWVLAPRGARFRQNSLWLLLVLLTGGFWYLRNLVAIGNPLPFALHLGPLRLPSPPGLSATSTVASFLLNGHDWRRYFLPGLRESLGPAWWAVLGMTVAGLILGACTSQIPVHRMLALVGIASGVAFVFTPQPLTVPVLYPNVPYDFVYNFRYSFSAFVIGLILLPITPVMRRPRSQWWLVGAFGIVVIATQLDSSIWPTTLFPQQIAPAIRGTDSQIGLLVGVVTFALGSFLLLGHLAPRPPTIVLIVTGVAILGFGFGLQQFYLRDRYLNTPPMAPLYAWARQVHDTRMAITGLFSNDTYPLDGQDDSNYVQLVGKVGPRGSFLPIVNCAEFRRVVNDGHYADVITVTGGSVQDSTATGAQQTMWMSDDPAAKLIFRRTAYGGLFKEVVFSVFHLNGRLDPRSCS
jgi:hypothetical protein